MRRIIIAIAALSSIMTASAQTDRTPALVSSDHNGWEYEVKAGVNIGGATPLPLPAEIRKISSYSPKMNASLEGTVTKWIEKDGPWGVSTGLKFEVKGMKTGATVKNYSTEIVRDGSKVAGYWTGYVQTNYNSTFLTIPVMANYRFNEQWKVRAGLYSSFKLDGEFIGQVSDGYLREGTPVGEKLVFENGNSASYNFSSALRHFQWGAQVGATWRAFNHFTVNADLTWAFNNIFESDFKTISFGLYPIYLNLGFGYRF